MAYNEKLGDRIREIISLTHHKVEEKLMFGGLCFMVNDKMCVGIVKDRLMARIDPDFYEQALELEGCGPMDFNHKPMKGFVFVEPEAISKQKKLQYWVDLALQFNKKAKATKKKK